MNLKVQTPNEYLRALVMPALTPVHRISLKRDDVLVVCAGFEDRAMTVLESAALNGCMNVLMITYTPAILQNKMEMMRALFTKHGITATEIVYDRCNPTGFGEQLMKEVSTYDGSIYFDVSAMSRLLIVQVIVTVRQSSIRLDRCFLTYSEARHYPPTKEEAEAELAKAQIDPTFPILFLSSGVFEVTIIPELSSVVPSVSQTRLISFPSLDAHYLTAIRSEIQPSRYSFIEGIPPSLENKWRTSIISKINHLDQFPDAERIATCTLEYRQTLSCLLDFYAKHAVLERLLISPTGSKMQTVAVGLFRSFFEDIQIVYPVPHGFRMPDKYTIGKGPLHLLSLALFA